METMLAQVIIGILFAMAGGAAGFYLGYILGYDEATELRMAPDEDEEED